MQDIQATLRQELDFVHEGHNGERCADELKHLSYVYVPKIHWDLTTKVRVVYQSLLSRKTNNSLGLQQHSVIECSLPARNVRFQQFGGGEGGVSQSSLETVVAPNSIQFYLLAIQYYHRPR